MDHGRLARDNGCVPVTPSEFVHQERIESAVAKASQALAPDVIRIRYNLGQDWSGSAAVFFRIVLSDDASRRERLRVKAQEVASTIFNQVRPDELGLQAYFNYRSASEQAELQEEAWA